MCGPIVLSFAVASAHLLVIGHSNLCNGHRVFLPSGASSGEAKGISVGPAARLLWNSSQIFWYDVVETNITWYDMKFRCTPMVG
jgi:hypothetical protein